MKKIILSLMSVVSIMACSDNSEENASKISNIVGTNDFIPVKQWGTNIPENLRFVIGAIGKMSNGCTATHIGNGLAITAGHCFQAPPYRVINLDCSNIKIKWGELIDAPAYHESTCSKLLAAEGRGDLDYAIMKLDNPPPHKIDVDIDFPKYPDTSITIFSHPKARTLEWSQYCKISDPMNANVMTDVGFSHQCDTEAGSSGAAVINMHTLKIIGIHDGTDMSWNYATYLSSTPLKEIIQNGRLKNPFDDIIDGSIFY